MKLACPSCGLPVPGADVDLARDRGVCRSCGELFPLSAAKPESGLALATDALKSPQATVLRPTELRWTERGSGADFVGTLTPSRWMAVPLLGFAAVWNGFLLVWYSAAFGFGGSKGGTAVMVLWFPLLHVGAGLFVTYQALCALFNSATFTLCDGRFRFRRGPIPERGGVDQRLDEIERVSILPHTTQGQRGASRTMWNIRLETRDGRAVRVALGLPSADHAEYIASRLDEACKAAVPQLTSYRG